MKTLLSRFFFLLLMSVLVVGPLSAQSPVSPQGGPTDTWAVQITDGTDPDAVAASLGFRNLGQIGSLEGYYLFRATGLRATSGVEAMTRTATLQNAPQILFAEQQIALPRYPRQITDPGYPNQWHIVNTGQGGGTAGEDANVIPAWNLSFTGQGVVVASVDDGVWWSHPDIAPNYLASASYDFVNDDTNPAGGAHGTSVAGVMAADNDGSECGVGIAYNAQVAGIRLPLTASQTDAQEAGALSHARDVIDVYNNSWGPSDDGRRLEGPRTLGLAALQQGVSMGRNGLGSIFVWAAGNGGLSNVDNVNRDGFANSLYTIAVAATTDTGVRPWYGEQGAPILVNAPSSGGSSGIYTTDAPGVDGYSSGDCTPDFGGTSSAAPLVAGVVGLMLEANPNLTWRDVQHILVETAEKNDPSHSDWTVNDAGYNINHFYGFGRVDAGAAVAAAQTWQTVEPLQTVTTLTQNVNQPIPNTTGLSVTSTINFPVDMQTEYVEVTLNASHTFRGEIIVELISPSGTVSQLMTSNNADNSTAGYSNWKLSTVRNWGENSNGTWTLRLRDAVPGNSHSGSLGSWSLTVHGTNVPPTSFTQTNPTNGAAVTAEDPVTFTWTESQNTLMYNFLLRRADGDMATLVNHFVLTGACVSGNCAYTVDLSSVPGITTGNYEWEVRAEGASSTVSASNAPLSLIINPMPLGAFALTSPAADALLTSVPAELVWEVSSGATSYSVTVDGTNGTFTPDNDSDALTCASVCTLSIASSPFAAVITGSGTYPWTVTALAALAEATASNAPLSFTVNVPVGPFALTGPADESNFNSPSQLAFTWGASENALDYTFTLEQQGSTPVLVFSRTVPVTSCESGICTYVPQVSDQALITDGAYQWSVLANDALNANPASNNPFRFTMTLPPVDFALTGPDDNAVIGDVMDVIFTWGVSKNAEDYTLVLERQEATPVVVFSVTLPQTNCNDGLCTFVPDASQQALITGGTYAWSMEASNAVGSSPASNNPFGFTLASPPTSFTLTEPINNVVYYDASQITFRWTESTYAEYYTITVETADGSNVIFSETLAANSCLSGACLYVPLPSQQALIVDGAYRWSMTANGLIANTPADNNPQLFTMDSSTAPQNLITNGSFEIASVEGAAFPDGWIVFRRSQDKRACPTTKNIASDGECAYRFRGSTTEDSRLTQFIELEPEGYVAGDVFTISAQVRATAPSAFRLKLNVFYTDGTEKSRLNQRVSDPTEGYILISENLVLSGPVQRVRIQLHNRSMSGKVFVDEVSLVASRASDATLPVPAASEPTVP